MDKEAALIEFLKGLRIALNNASAYSKEHPYFRKSIEAFKEKVDSLISFLNPIKINFTPESLIIDGRKMEKSMLYTDLASMFHKRKIKSIEIRAGFTVEELIGFLSSVSLPIKEILKQGGMRNILEKAESRCIKVDELDYSEFLEEEGQDTKDVWEYLFNEAVRKGDPGQIAELTDNWGNIISKLKAKDLLEDDKMRESLHNFLDFLKTKEKGKFNDCSGELLKHVLKEKNVSSQPDIDKIRAFFKDLDNNSLVDILWERISGDETFNPSSFQLFSQLVGPDAHKEVARGLGEKVKSNPAMRKRIKDLFLGSDKSSVLEFYRHEFSSPLKDASMEESLSFDRDFLPVNYFLVLLNLFSMEEDKEKLDLVSKRLLPECDRLIFQKQSAYLKYLWEVLDKKRKDGSLAASDFIEFQKRIYAFVENESFLDKPCEGLEYFIDKLDKSILGEDFYYNKLFKEGKSSPFALSLFLRLFPPDSGRFYECLKERRFDIDLMAKIVKSTQESGSPLTLEVLKNIFLVSGNVIKIEVLKSMQLLPQIDPEFLFSVLEKEDILLKREALAILVKDADLRKKALDKLLFIKSVFGSKNKQIIQNLMVMEDKKIEEALDYVASLSKKRFFWNRGLRKKALEVLRSWDAAKN